MKSNKELIEKLDKDFSNKIKLWEFIQMLESWKVDCNNKKNKYLQVDMWGS